MSGSDEGRGFASTIGGLALVTLVGLMAATGCGVDPPNEDSCVANTDCAGGEFCGDDGTCQTECTTEADCSGSDVCSDRGQCVARDCTADTECSDGHYCADGQCTQDCDPSAGSGCAAGERCSDRGRCVVAGECLEDADCDDPPSARCDGNTRQTYAGPGTCKQNGSTFSCTYELQEKSCAWGCKDGACRPDPCENVVCEDPPASTCKDDETLVTYQTPGTCQSDDDGNCTYRKEERSCAHGCKNGECQSGPCENVACDSPPSDTCEENTAVTYRDSGTCEKTDEGTECSYSPMYDNCSYTGATCENASCTDPVSQKGGLVITEFMADPDAVSDREGEWFEVYNPGSSDIQLKGWQLASQDDSGHTVAQSLTVPAGGRAVLARDADPLNGSGAISPDYIYDSIVMANGGDWLRIKNADGDVVDHLYYESGAPLDGRSRKLDPSIEATASSNDDLTNWCPSLSSGEQLGSTSEYGSPGNENPACSEMPCSNFTCEKPTAFCRSGDAVRPTKDQASCEVSSFNNPYCDYEVKTFNCTDEELCVTGQCESIPSNLPAQGDLVITEMMGNPDAVPDTDGEWIEVYNPTSKKLSLFSIVIRDSESGGKRDSYTVVETGAEIASKSYAVFARETDSSKNGGISGAFGYTGSHLKNSPDGLTISLVRQDGTVVDTTHYGKPKAGTAQQLGRSSYKGASSPAANNDTAENWCEARTSYGDGDLGTPGSENADCQ